MLKQLIIVILCVLNLSGAAQTIDVPEILNSPKMDGTLNDSVWQKASKIDNFHLHQTATSAQDTTAYVYRDKTWLYFGFKCDNKAMKHLKQIASEHDGPVCNDDSVEIFIDPGTNGRKTRQFMLNFANVKLEKTFGLKGTSPQIGWSCPWRSATKRLNGKGWTAEVAIPFYALNDGDMSKMKINLLRNKVVPEIDVHGAVQGEKTEHFILNGDKVKDVSTYVEFSGLDGFVPVIPFIPQINNLKLGSFQEKDGKYYYSLSIAVSPATEVAGDIQTCVEEMQNGEIIEHKGEIIKLDESKAITINVPVKNFNKRAVTAILRDKNGNLLASVNVPDSSSLAIVKDAFVGRNYYTSEKNAEIKIIFGISKEILKKFIMQISANGKNVFRKENPDVETIAQIPLSKLKLGNNKVRLAIAGKNKELFSTEYNISKLEPKPGYEVKADFIRKVILKDGKPFFPLGINIINSENNERHYKMLSQIGFNTLMPSASRYGKTDLRQEMELAQKYNMQVIFEGISRSKVSPIFGGNLSLKSARTNYDKELSIFQKRLKILTNYKNLFMYFTGHEPNCGDNPSVNVKIMEWSWKELQKIDPYHPTLAVYTKHIPAGDEWTRWVDVLSDDIYIRPWTGTGLLSEPGIGNAFYANKIRLRCEKDHKIMFMVPLAGQHSIDKGPVGNSNQQMLCQNYVSLIYGAKGTIFFCNTTVSNYDSWNGIKTICEQTKHLAPALLNYEVKQQISYPNQKYDPLGAIFPQVLGRVFKYPDGDYVLLAANLRHFAAKSKFEFPGAKNVYREFGDRKSVSMNAGVFTDDLEPFGVRAYRIKAPTKKMFKVAIFAEANKEVQAPAIDIPGIIRQMRLGKNHCPNPCFERQLINGTPDFYNPYYNVTEFLIYDPGKKGSSWFVDDAIKWNGRTSLCIDNTKKHHTRGVFGACYPPITDKPLKMVFSFYAKAANENDTLIVNLLTLANERKTFKLTKEWQRYNIPMTVNPPKHRNNGVRTILLMPSGNAKVWISGLQLEKGDKPTEFRDDSIIKKKT